MTDQLTCLARIHDLIRQLPVVHELTVDASLPYITRCYELMNSRDQETMCVSIDEVLKALDTLSRSAPPAQYKWWVCKDVPTFSVELAKFLQNDNIPVDVWEYRDSDYATNNIPARTIGVILHLYHP